MSKIKLIEVISLSFFVSKYEIRYVTTNRSFVSSRKRAEPNDIKSLMSCITVPYFILVYLIDLPLFIIPSCNDLRTWVIPCYSMSKRESKSRSSIHTFFEETRRLTSLNWQGKKYVSLLCFTYGNDILRLWLSR